MGGNFHLLVCGDSHQHVELVNISIQVDQYQLPTEEKEEVVTTAFLDGRENCVHGLIGGEEGYL